MVALRGQGNWWWEGPLGTPLGLVHWKRASSPVEAGTSGFLCRVDRWGGGCLMNCRELRELHITRVAETHGDALAFLCDELHEELTVTIRGVDGTETRLIFPEYVEIYEENVPNHHFDYHIHGGGHPYHHVCRANQLDLRVYDGLWD